MENRPKELRLSKKQSANLLKLGLGPGQAGPNRIEDDARADLLSEKLASKMPVDPGLLESLPAVLRSLSEQLESISGSPVGELLLNPTTKIAVIRRIKDYAKDLGNEAGDESHREVALTIYFTAIAHGLVHHGVKISQHSYAGLQETFERLCRYDWIPPDLGRLFADALGCCADKV